MSVVLPSLLLLLSQLVPLLLFLMSLSLPSWLPTGVREQRGRERPPQHGEGGPRTQEVAPPHAAAAVSDSEAQGKPNNSRES